MKLRVTGLTFAIVAMACGSAMAQAGGSIGIYSDLAGTGCSITAPQYVATNFYILAKPNTANTAGGVNGAEFRVKGAPGASLLLTPTANPAANVTIGTPFSDESLAVGSRGGANIAFPQCQIPDGNGFVVLYTVSAFSISAAEVEFVVDAKDPASNPSFQCPLINACNSPIFSSLCVTPGKGYLNHSNPLDCLPVAVSERSWGEVKNLYN